MNGFKNRIVKFDLVDLNDILFHPDNWRIHPTRQQDAMKKAMLKIGWADTVTVNLRTSEAWPQGERNVQTLIDGHMRVMLAARSNETLVPVAFVDLDPEEEAYFLATFDPLGQLAATDNQKLLDLVARLQEQDKAAVAALRGAGIDARQTFAHIEQADQSPVHPKGELPALPEPKADARQLEQKYPLAIVLDRRDYERWLAWREKAGTRSDTQALIVMLDKLEGSGE